MIGVFGPVRIYALAWISGKALPPLATTSPVGTAQAIAGIQGQASTNVLIGSERISNAFAPWASLISGSGSIKAKLLGWRGLFRHRKQREFLQRDFGQNSDHREAFHRCRYHGSKLRPGEFSRRKYRFGQCVGELKDLLGSLLRFSGNRRCGTWWRLESLIGYRFCTMEKASTRRKPPGHGGAFIPGTKILTFDSFRTKNDFNGCEFGFRTEVSNQRWSLEILTKLAAGNIRREVSINAARKPPCQAPHRQRGGGVYALSSNIGNHFTSDWVVAPEIGLNLCYQLNDNARVRLAIPSFISRISLGQQIKLITL